MNEPFEPLTDLAVAAAHQHELFLAWVDAGFTPDQAMDLLVAVVVELFRGSND